MLLFDLENLQKHYGAFEAIKGLTLKVPEGSVGLLGPNGAGKSTLIKTLIGLLEFSRGSASVLGFRLPDEKTRVLQSIGYMPENDCYLPYMSAIDYVSFGGQLAGMPRAEAFRRAHEVLYYVGLTEARYRKLSGFSTGMKQRVKLAQALVHGPRLVFLDEPTNGLDPRGREEMLSLIEDVKSRGVNLVLSTHLLADVERLCEQIIMLNRGEVIYQGSIQAFKQGEEDVVEVETKQQDELLRQALQAKGIRAEPSGLRLKVFLAPGADPQQILDVALERGVQIRHFMPAQMTMEEAFLGLLEPSSSPADSPASSKA